MMEEGRRPRWQIHPVLDVVARPRLAVSVSGTGAAATGAEDGASAADATADEGDDDGDEEGDEGEAAHDAEDDADAGVLGARGRAIWAVVRPEGRG